MKKYKKIILFLAFALGFSSPFSTLAYSFNVGPFSTSVDVNQILQEVNQNSISSLTDLSTQSVEERYGFTSDIWATAQRKANAPKVELFFDNSNPVEGEKVTAHAIPEYFRNDPQNLYYTWYLIHAEGGSSIDSGKREAAKIAARGDYDYRLDCNLGAGKDACKDSVYAASKNKDPDKDGWPPIDSSYKSDEKAAPFGGADGIGQACYKHQFGTNTNVGSTEVNSGKDVSENCSHKWENAGPDCTADDCESGSGKFPTGEERYWETDPTDPDTDGDGFVDEADVIGLGQQDFTWTYQKGDRLGVVVEGTSMIPVDELNSFYKIMWGYLDVCDETKANLMEGDKCDGADDYGYGYLATRAPSEEGLEGLKVSLSYTPDNPVADANGADRITVNSSLNNTDLNAANIYYTWQIQKGVLGNEDSWKELDLKKNFDTATVSNGLGLSSFSFSPKTSAMSGGGDLAYFKVTLTASRSSGIKSKRGRASVIIPVNKKGISLKFYKVDTSSGKAILGKEVCESGAYCPVVHNQLLAARASSSDYTSSNSDFAWSINGKAYPLPSDPSDLFTGWNGTTIFFAIIENEGETPNVSVTATPKDTLQPVMGSRALSVVKPAVFITTNDSSASWPRTYLAEDNSSPNSTYEVASSTVFESLAESEVSYNLNYIPDYLFEANTNTSIDWKIDGTSIGSGDFSESDLGLSGVATENDGRTLKFTTGAADGVYHTIEAVVKRYWSADEKNILGTAWGISPDTLESSYAIDLNSIALSSVGESASANPGQFLAAVGTHLPHYFMYLLRLVLTLVVMSVVSAGFFSLTQRLNLGGETK
jgi:hypothetical protein